MKILVVDVGLKNNQLRCLISRGAALKVVPWNYDFNADTDYDGLFLSNGPGNPAVSMCRPSRHPLLMVDVYVDVQGDG